MKRGLTFAYPGKLELNTGGYAYDRKVIDGLRNLGWAVTPLGLGDGFPAPPQTIRAEAEARLSALDDGSLVVIDGLAFGVLDNWAVEEADRLKIVALVHHPLALETGLSQAEQADLREREKRALQAARLVIVTSPMTARELSAHYAVPSEAITVAIPGTEPAPRASLNGNPPLILSIGTLIPRKGHDVLLDALKLIQDIEWNARIIGSRDLDPATAKALEARVRAHGLQHRITLTGESIDTRAALASADVFALASRYEGFGMVFAEALSQGVPIVACAAGAVPEVVPAEAGFLVPIDDVEAFAGALRRLLTDPAEHSRRAAAALEAGTRLPRWHDTAQIIASRLADIA
ncbi:glycosyltransferase family 4 protein [Oryzicola mucosus]|uniref:Glycosyltransferase family 4 protein n=1 Tax=Oryzicola mucosus TaxID=2767425 RepID=A0A8J6U224_9HYPH|nr:glycosyltransferase family 4 protein [Oryzicola mucosus]MBD0415303.1 glycosyltransferase family 4 protein [Oryzicola mucosus]